MKKLASRTTIKRKGPWACHFDKLCLEDSEWWVETQRNTALKMLELVKAVLRDPETGVGKPERLKELGLNVWSRRITQEHRLVYVVLEDRVTFVMARFHYG